VSASLNHMSHISYTDLSFESDNGD
jgi:hypothetical protein